MNLPNYFLADLPPEATLNSMMLAEACQTLKRNRERYLLPRSTPSLTRTLATLSSNWMDPEFPFRKLALEQGPKNTGFPTSTLARGLDSFFEKITLESLTKLLDQELGHPLRLDQMCSNGHETNLGTASMALGPELIFHITGGVLPNPNIMSIMLGLLAKSAQLIKCPTGGSYLTRLFAHSLYDSEPKLAACLEVAEWRGGNQSLEDVAFLEADCVTATGSDETLASIRQRISAKARFLGYGDRVSFGYITREVLSGFNIKKIVSRAAEDIIAWNQLGCLSPHLFYTEQGGTVSSEKFAGMLAEELARREEIEPRGILPVELSADIASRRSFYEVRSAHSPETTQHWFSEGSTAWTVIHETNPLFQKSCMNRFVYVKGVSDLNECLPACEAVRGKVSTVGLAATDDRAEDLATQFARWGVTRICPLGEMQRPPVDWRHDGRPALGDLVTWSSWCQ